MISITQAERIIQSNLPRFSKVRILLEKALNRILQEDIHSDRDFPAFDKALMDGIAIASQTLKSGINSFKIIGLQSAGERQKKLKSKNYCFEIATGAILPQGCDCVIPIENVRIQNGQAQIIDQPLMKPFQFIQKKGSEYKKGQVVLKKGVSIRSPQIAILASVGKSKVCVSVQPKIAVIATGDELVAVHKTPKAFQVRQSNASFLVSAFLQTGLFKTHLFHLKDNKAVLYKKLKSILQEFDCLVLSGGVSMGKKDYIPSVLQELGVKVLFHKVAQKPGKPLWVGKSKEDKLVFALPGNPGSTQICAYRYVLPALKKALGLSEYKQWALLVKDFQVKTGFTSFVPVRIRYNFKACLEATPVAYSGSGDIVSFSNSDGFVELKAKTFKFSPGFIAPFYSW